MKVAQADISHCPPDIRASGCGFTQQLPKDGRHAPLWGHHCRLRNRQDVAHDFTTVVSEGDGGRCCARRIGLLDAAGPVWRAAGNRNH